MKSWMRIKRWGDRAMKATYHYIHDYNPTKQASYPSCNWLIATRLGLTIVTVVCFARTRNLRLEPHPRRGVHRRVRGTPLAPPAASLAAQAARAAALMAAAEWPTASAFGIPQPHRLWLLHRARWAPGHSNQLSYAP